MNLTKVSNFSKKLPKTDLPDFLRLFSSIYHRILIANIISRYLIFNFYLLFSGYITFYRFSVHLAIQNKEAEIIFILLWHFTNSDVILFCTDNLKKLDTGTNYALLFENISQENGEFYPPENISYLIRMNINNS
jgi:hypothetical protein